MTVSDRHLRTICQDAVADRIVAGLTIMIGHDGRSHSLHTGHRQVEPRILPVTDDTLWDLASLTKPLVTSLLCMTALPRAAINLDEPLLETPGVTLRRALSHSAGFPAHRAFYTDALASGGGRAAVIAAAARVPLEYPPGTRSIYSDIGFILLGDWLERRLGAPLDRLAADLFAPLDVSMARETGRRLRLAYRPVTPGDGSPIAGSDLPDGLDIAATERCPVRRRVVVGEVHDLNAYAMGGVAGHAGLFGDAASVAEVAHELCAAYHGSSHRAGHDPLVDREVLRLFWSPAAVPGSNWRLGWDGPSPVGSLAGDILSRAGVGHLAFTGCSLWIDPQQSTFVLVLSNRVHPVVADDGRFRQLRRALNDAALTAIGYRA
jgi:CubicO group peptidase (beta-lactamase class C family)